MVYVEVAAPNELNVKRYFSASEIDRCNNATDVLEMVLKPDMDTITPLYSAEDYERADKILDQLRRGKLRVYGLVAFGSSGTDRYPIGSGDAIPNPSWDSDYVRLVLGPKARNISSQQA